MATISISYSALANSARQAKNTGRELADYANALTRRISDTSGSLPGTDDCGYISDAVSKAWNKVSELNEKQAKLERYSASVNEFIDISRSCDKKAAQEMDRLTEDIAKSRKWYEKIGDWIFNTFMVDIPNSNPVTRLLMDCYKLADDFIKNRITDIKNWFQHGSGRYVWNIIDSALSVVGAALTAVTAVLSAGTFLGIIFAVAACVSLIITLVNSQKKIDANAKALKLDRESPGAARFYGSIDGLSDYFAKTDMGNKEQNDRAKMVGDVVDTIEVIADTIGLVSGAADVGGIKNNDGVIYKYDFSKKNKDTIIKNIHEKLDFKHLYDKDKYNEKYILQVFNGTGLSEKQVQKAIHGFAAIDAANKGADIIDKGIKVIGAGQDGKGFEGIKNAIGVIGNIFPVGGDFDKIISNVEKLRDIYTKEDRTFNMKNFYTPVRVPNFNYAAAGGAGGGGGR